MRQSLDLNYRIEPFQLNNSAIFISTNGVLNVKGNRYRYASALVQAEEILCLQVELNHSRVLLALPEGMCFSWDDNELDFGY